MPAEGRLGHFLQFFRVLLDPLWSIQDVVSTSDQGVCSGEGLTRRTGGGTEQQEGTSDKN